MIEDNTVLGNTNGIILVPGVEGNIVRHNVVVGNPPVQISVTFPLDGGVDIRNQATPGTNTIDDNFCLTSVNAPRPAIGRRKLKPRLDVGSASTGMGFEGRPRPEQRHYS